MAANFLRVLFLTLLLILPEFAQAFYNPTIGRWVSRDPVEESGGLNLNEFNRNDPINFYDDDGLLSHNNSDGAPGLIIYTSSPSLYNQYANFQGKFGPLVNARVVLTPPDNYAVVGPSPLANYVEHNGLEYRYRVTVSPSESWYFYYLREAQYKADLLGFQYISSEMNPRLVGFSPASAEVLFGTKPVACLANVGRLEGRIKPPVDFANSIPAETLPSKFNIGGVGEAPGFVDVVTPSIPKPMINGRAFTSTFESGSASDIFLRNAPMTPEIAAEIVRLSRSGTRITTLGPVNPAYIQPLTDALGSNGSVFMNRTFVAKYLKGGDVGYQESMAGIEFQLLKIKAK